MVHMTLADTFEFQAARSMKQTHQLKFSNVDDVVIVWMPEDLFELLSIVQTGEELTKYIDHSKPKKLVISFDHVRSFGSQAVGDLIKVTKRVRAYGGDVKLCSMSTRGSGSSLSSTTVAAGMAGAPSPSAFRSSP